MSPRTILIVEDNDDFFEALMMCLEGAFEGGIRPIWAKNSSVAMEILRSVRVDAVITDYHLSPGTSEPLLDFLAEGGVFLGLSFTKVICMSSYAQAVGGFKTAVREGASFVSKSDPQFAGKIVEQVRERLISAITAAA